SATGAMPGMGAEHSGHHRCRRHRNHFLHRLPVESFEVDYLLNQGGDETRKRKSDMCLRGSERNSAMRRGDLADLTAFITVAEHLSFRAAAARLGVTPSALSHTMRQLEDRVGVRLLNRTTRSVSVTDAGRRLLERLQPAIDQVTGALEDLNREREKPFGRLRIHANQTSATAV